MARKRRTTAAGLRPNVAAELRNVQKSRLPWLDLRRKGLTEIPDEVFGLTHVEWIDLSQNELRAIPQRLWDLPKLQGVNLIGNPIESLPDRPNLVIDGRTYIRCRNQVNAKNLHLVIDPQSVNEGENLGLTELRTARGLRSLTIGQWALTIGAEHPKPSPAIQEVLGSLADLEFLESLSLRGLRLDAVPEGIRRLPQLRSLALNALGLRALPAWIGQLNLTQLSAFDNKLSDLPLLSHSLESINVDWNAFEQIPASIFKLSSLTTLSVRGCQIREIPEDLLRLRRLTELRCDENPIESPPAEVAYKGLEAIRNYWRQRADTGVDYLCEAKLIILGEAGAGKTSLARKIENPNYKLREREKSTEGIDVIGYQFDTAIRARDDGKETVLQRRFQVNIWDFGGQEIYHATHQFFLTRRSVYVLVCDDRKEDTDFSYWLHVVEMLSNASPLLIVQNEKQDRTRDINASSLRARFSNLRDVLAVNLDTNRGLDGVIQSIRKELESLPHVGVGLPATWKRVREALERDERDTLGLEEYLDICQEHGFTRRADKLQLSGYLHDLGICLHFQDDPLLKKTVILKPSWGTDAVYRVLDDPEVIAARGRFTRRQLERIWSEEKYAGMQDELLGLMMKFQLCYALESGQEWIAPQLLSSEQPSYPWEPAGGLVLRYDYEFLPKGIVTRLIVAMHRLIAGGKLVWKTGVVLEREGNRAEILEEYSQRRIRVRVNGPDPRGLLSIVDEQLERLHASFPRLQYEKFLPCPCSECQDRSEPYGFALENLIKRANKNQQIQCHASGEMVDAARLVREIVPGALRREEHSADPTASRIAPQVSPSTPLPEVFVSYAWNAESSEIVDRLQQTLGQQGIRLIRDREEVRYRDSIRDFMRRIGQGKCVVVVISEKYLKSENCMFEMVEVEKARGLHERIFPIVLADADIYKATGRVRYVRYWEKQIRELDKALKTVRGDNLTKLQEDLNVYAEIRRLFDGIADTLRDMNALTPDQHEGSGFDELIRRIRVQLSV
ncbi:MAG TPA: COR domain-containing protein [Thermoanaerobaculia bacterium]|nr:COR domain-containing protein [Thermoanaerobaculia bacterium]